MRGSVVQKRHSGKWYVVLDLERDGSGQGRRQKCQSGYATKREAERALAALLAARYDAATSSRPG